MRYIYHRDLRHARHRETDDRSLMKDARHARHWPESRSYSDYRHTRHWPESTECTGSETETPRDDGSGNDTESDLQ